MISVHDVDPGGTLGRLAGFRREFHRCLTARSDALFELTDALLCGDTPVRSLVELSLAGEHRRGHGSLYAALNRGRIDIEALKTAVAGVPVPRAADGRIVLAVDVTCWLRPEAHTSPQRMLCHTYGRGKDTHMMIPGWPYSLVTALETGRSSWTAPLDVRRLGPGDDTATVTAAQLREVVQRLITAGQWQPGDKNIWIVADAGYDGPRLAFLLADLPVTMLVRMRSDRVLRRHAPSEPAGNGRPPRHGGEFIFGAPASWGEPDAATVTDTRLYGMATARSWNRLHPRLTHRTAWTTHIGVLPIIEGTVVLLTVDRLPSGATAKPVWLWWSHPEADAAMTDLLWQAFLRRFDIEHTFRMLKQTLGWTSPKLRNPAAADRWTWLVLAAYTQLRLARTAVADLRRPWERPAPPERLTPARVRRGFRHLHGKAGTPAAAPKPSQPGPGRPPGRRNTHPTTRHDVHTVTSTKPASSNKKPKK
ncbi:NF041680 family putative transposase, partial [Paractinoplanes ferrugineus]|uniref:NF041680 family putative transposase n=1 Tax=Paractinoplanes ferrugineus TaxID=113564 RepID=UPI001940466A